MITKILFKYTKFIIQKTVIGKIAKYTPKNKYKIGKFTFE